MAKRRGNPDQMPMDFLLPETDWEPPSRLPSLSGEMVVAVDIETKDDGLANNIGAGWAYRMGHVSGVVITTSQESVYLPIRHPDTECWEESTIRAYLADLFQSDTWVVFHNAVYDLGWLCAVWGLPYPRRLHDTMVLEYTLDENQMTYNLDAVCARRGIQGKDETLLKQAAAAYSCDPKKDLWRMPGKFVGPYAEQDGRATLELLRLLLPMLDAQGCGEAYRLECDLIPMVVDMRKTGIRINTDRAEQLQKQFNDDRDDALSRLSDIVMVGRPLSIKDVNSPKFLEGVFRAANLPIARTPTGAPSFESEVISKLDHPIADLVVEAKQMNDAANKFIKTFVLGYSHRGRIHAEIRLTKSDDGGTRTSRLAYSDPPLQQMPSRNPRIKRRIRSAFLPEEGQVWGALDYSQQEYRLIVHFAYLCKQIGADRAVQMYRQNPRTDFHTMVAEMTKLPRKKAKDVNFAKAFGAGVPKFALMTGMSLEEAEETMAQYDNEMPFVKGLGKYCESRAKARGYIRLIDGARSRYELWEPTWLDKGLKFHPACSLEEAHRRLRDPDHSWYGKKLKRAMVHKAMNSLIQGSAARMTKLSMRGVYQEGLVPMLQMHDELDFSFSEKWQAERAEEIMRTSVELVVPVVVDAEFGPDWGAAEADKDTGWGATWEDAWRLVA